MHGPSLRRACPAAAPRKATLGAAKLTLRGSVCYETARSRREMAGLFGCRSDNSDNALNGPLAPSRSPSPSTDMGKNTLASTMKNAVTLLCAALALTPAALHAAGDPQAGKSKSQVCAACHGADGNSTDPQFPVLAGQHASYIVKQLMDFKAAKTRSNAIMSGMVASLSQQDMEDLAAYFAQQTRRGGYTPEQYVARGQKVFRAGDASTKVPACMSCHGPGGNGNPLAVYPSLWGQHAQYTEKQLHDFSSGSRSNDPNGMMRDIATRMTDHEIKAVAEYLTGLYSTWPK
jgi:cytochrome c553